MRKALFVALFFVFCAPLALAQSEYKRGEIGGGYSANWVDSQGAFNTSPTDTSRDMFNGFYVNGGGNWSRYWGVQAEVAHYRKTTDFTNNVFQTGTLRGRITEGLIGVKVQDNATETRVRPFARALVGIGHVSADGTVVTSPTSTVSFSQSDNGFAGVLGGGVAFRIGPHADFVTSADWNPIHISDTGTAGSSDWTHNFRVGVGINFRFGNK